MKCWKRWCIALVSIAGWQAGLANSIVVDDTFSCRMLGKEVRYWATDADTFPYEAVLALPDSAFTTAPKPGFFFSLEQKGYWLRFSIQAQQESNLIFEVVNPYIQNFHFYVRNANGLIQADTLGADLVFAERYFAHRNWQIPLLLPPGDSTVCLLHFPPGRSPLQFDLYLWDHVSRQNHQSLESTILTAFFVVMLVYLTLIFLVNQVARFPSLRYYLIYVALGALLLFADLGMGYQYLWPGKPYLHQASNLVISNLYLLAGLQFVRVYFDTPAVFPGLNQAIIVIMGIAAALVPFAVGQPLAPLRFSHLLHLMHYTVFLSGLACAIAVFILSIVKQQRILAGWFLFGFGLHGIGILLTIVQYFGWFPLLSSTRWFYNWGLPLPFFPQMAMMAGTLIEVPVLLYVAFYRFRSLYEDAQRQAISRENNLNDLVMTIENERKRLGQDLHDSLGVQLAAIKMKLSVLQGKLTDGLKPELEQVIKDVEQASQEMRAISHNLLPPSLERHGLAAAVEHLLHRMQSVQPTLKTHFYSNAPLEQLTPRARLHLYRILSELITNAVKHGGARALSVQLVRYENRIQATVEDDGLGFDLAEIRRKNKGIGLGGIEYRAKALGGRFELDARPGRGTFASLEVPMERVLAV